VFSALCAHKSSRSTLCQLYTHATVTELFETKRLKSTVAAAAAVEGGDASRRGSDVDGNVNTDAAAGHELVRDD
jgi:hypothetical protein